MKVILKALILLIFISCQLANNSPEIELLGDETVILELNNDYIEPGYSAYDEEDGTITNKVIITSNLDSSIVGEYEIHYKVTDSDGANSVTLVRKVIVVDKVSSLPLIVLLGENVVTLEPFSVFYEPGFYAADKEDGYLTASVNISDNVDYNTPGKYNIEYSVSDSDDNSVVVSREIVISSYKKLKNVIFFIGDGMGKEHIKATSIYKTGLPGQLFFESFPIIRSITTHSANSEITDTGAAATAMGTGKKVNNRVISKNLPGDGSNLDTILEFYRDVSFKTGIITTVSITKATTAAFAAHQDSISMVEEIALEYFTQTRPNFLLGGGGYGVSEALALDNNYLFLKNRDQMDNLQWNIKSDYISGQFGEKSLPSEYNGDYSELPHLTEMVSFILTGYDESIDGLFLLVEGARIDDFSHDNFIVYTIPEILEFEQSVKLVYDWAADRNDTLIIVTSDHETGGLKVEENLGKNMYPYVTWSTEGHTSSEVNAYFYGLYSELFKNIEDNTDFYSILKKAYSYGRN